MKYLMILLMSLFFNTSFAGLNEILWDNPDGSACTSDYECASLCCDSNNSCAPHNTNGSQCNKPAGESCITSDFCHAEYVATCRLYKLGTNADGSVACAMRCPAVLTKGDCMNGYCRAPAIPPVPTWDGVDCSSAI